MLGVCTALDIRMLDGVGKRDGGMLDSGLSGTNGGTPTFFTTTALDNGTFEGSMSTSLAVGGGRSILLDDGGGMLDSGLSDTNGGTPTFFTTTALDDGTFEGSM